jgi:hypothetical protein
MPHNGYSHNLQASPVEVRREHTPRRQTARATLAVPPRQARMVGLSSSNGLSGSGVCYTAGRRDFASLNHARDSRRNMVTINKTIENSPWPSCRSEGRSFL